MIFLTMLAHQAGHPLDFGRLEPERFLEAMVASFRGDTASLAKNMRRLLA
jgi:cell filamentation protein